MVFKLPVLGEHTPALETCAYCPKLCRAECPVSNAIPTDSLTPWGKMTMAWLASRGDVPPRLTHTDVVWGCSGCHACSQACEHKNPVATTLIAARQLVRATDAAPALVERLIQRHARRAGVVRERAARAARDLLPASNGRNALVVGCGYWLYEPSMARQLVVSVHALLGELTLVTECCGAVLEQAGDKAGYEAARERMHRQLVGADKVLVHDPGCARTLADYPVQTVVELAAQHLDRLKPVPERIAALGPLRYHDPCQLGRGLGKYEEPRRVLQRLAGERVQEFLHNRSSAKCSGGGAVLPQSYPDAASLIAQQRGQEHLKMGGGTIVTACAASLRQFRRAGLQAVDFAHLLKLGVPRQ